MGRNVHDLGRCCLASQIAISLSHLKEAFCVCLSRHRLVKPAAFVSGFCAQFLSPSECLHLCGRGVRNRADCFRELFSEFLSSHVFALQHVARALVHAACRRGVHDDGVFARVVCVDRFPVHAAFVSGASRRRLRMRSAGQRQQSDHRRGNHFSVELHASRGWV